MSVVSSQVSEGEPTQHFVLHSVVRLTVGAVIGCGMFMSNVVHADTVPKDMEVRVDVKPEVKSGLTSSVMSKTGDVVTNALGMIGLRYRLGGNTPEPGLDCSGFVRYAFNDTSGFLPLCRAVKMSRVGTNVDTAELRPGDLMFFNTMRHTFSHVDIYIDDNKFMHAPSTGSKICADDTIVSYWATRYNGTRRIKGNSGAAIKDGADSFVEQLKRVNPNVVGKSLVMHGG